MPTYVYSMFIFNIYYANKAMGVLKKVQERERERYTGT